MSKVDRDKEIKGEVLNEIKDWETYIDFFKSPNYLKRPDVLIPAGQLPRFGDGDD